MNKKKINNQIGVENAEIQTFTRAKIEVENETVEILLLTVLILIGFDTHGFGTVPRAIPTDCDYIRISCLTIL